MIMDCEKYVGKCVCGREHELETKKVVVEYGAINNFEQYMADVGLAGKRRAVIYDTVIYKLTEGKHVAADQEIVLEANGLRAEDTVIDYPVVHGTDNEYYLKRLYTGQKNRNGSVFVDCGNTGLFTEQNTLIFGHNMQSGAMFGTLKGYKKQDYYDAHPTMTLYTPAGDYTLELIAGTVEDGSYTFAKCSFDSVEEFFDYVADLKSRSTFRSSVEVQEGDRLVSLCTCTYEFSNARYVVVGKLTPLP